MLSFCVENDISLESTGVSCSSNLPIGSNQVWFIEISGAF